MEQAMERKKGTMEPTRSKVREKSGTLYSKEEDPSKEGKKRTKQPGSGGFLPQSSMFHIMERERRENIFWNTRKEREGERGRGEERDHIVPQCDYWSGSSVRLIIPSVPRFLVL